MRETSDRDHVAWDIETTGFGWSEEITVSGFWLPSRHASLVVNAGPHAVDGDRFEEHLSEAHIHCLLRKNQPSESNSQSSSNPPMMSETEILNHSITVSRSIPSRGSLSGWITASLKPRLPCSP